MITAGLWDAEDYGDEITRLQGIILFIHTFTLARLQTVFGWSGVFIQPVPFFSEGDILQILCALHNLFIFICGNLRWRRTPTVAVARQHEKIRARRGVLAACCLSQADVHRLLIQGSFIAYPPAQVDGSKTGSKIARLAPAGAGILFLAGHYVLL